MDFSFTVSASVERTEGKFAAREELESQLIEAIEGADPGSVEGDNGGQYEVTDWSVDANPVGKAAKVPKAKEPPAPAPQPTPFVPIIKAYVAMNYAIETSDTVKQEIATEALTTALDALLERFPNVVTQEYARLKAEAHDS